VIDALGNVDRVLLLGGTSEIGLAVTCELLGGRSGQVVLAARSGPRAAQAAEDLRLAGHAVSSLDFDAEDVGSHPDVAMRAFAAGDVDVVVVAFGLLGDQEEAWRDHAAAVRLATVNYTGAVSMGVLAAQHLSAQGRGSIIALSSVAGERPRRSNFVYGSTKAGMDAFYTGLREALRPAGVSVLVVRPGFVRSRMTEGLEVAPMSVDPGTVARLAVKAWRSGREVVYTPGTLRPVMSVLRHLPSPAFRRLPI
jgi:decaprenylphospho-beta-D-erythro-pentofuranosid-2-ulose 2-reductase